METPPAPDYVQYPRPLGLPSGVPPRPPGVQFDAINDGWALFAREWTTWVATQLVIGVLYLLIWIPFFLLTNRLE